MITAFLVLLSTSIHCKQSVKTVEDTSGTIIPKVNPYVVTLTVEDKQLLLLIQGNFSLVSDATYHELWPNTPLHDTIVKHMGTPVQVLGVMQETVLYDQQLATLSLLVIARTGASLMGST